MPQNNTQQHRDERRRSDLGRASYRFAVALSLSLLTATTAGIPSLHHIDRWLGGGIGGLTLGGSALGAAVGSAEGSAVGSLAGSAVGYAVGSAVGSAVGCKMGDADVASH